MDAWLDKNSGELMILLLFLITVATLIVLVPQLLRAHLRKQEMLHLEHMKALENGQPIPLEDDRAKVAGRMAMLVPMVALITAGSVTCFLAAYKMEQIFTISLAVWSVSGVVSLAAITGGVALIGRLAHLQSGGLPEEEESEDPLLK